MHKIPTVMVDLDDTLVSFSEMFCDRWNRYISQMAQYIPFYDRHKTLTLNDITEYNFLESLKKLYKYNNTVEHHFNKCVEELFADENLYDNPYLTPEFYRIINLLQTDFKNYKKVLNTKVSTPEMMISKAKLFKNNVYFQLFDEIIVDMEKGMNHSPKPTHYDVMIDDAPTNIKNYLEMNHNGIVYMPVRKFNEYILDWECDRVRPL